MFSIPECVENSLKKYFKNHRIKNLPKTPCQSINSNFCGFYCILSVMIYEIKCENEKKKNNIVNINFNQDFSKKDLKKNDQICINKISVLYKEITPIN